MHVHGLNKRCGLPPPGRPGCAFAKIAKTINECVSFAGDGRRIGKAPRRGNAVACKSFRYSSVSLLTRSSCVSATCKPHSLHGLIHFDIVAGWNEKSNRCLARGKVETPAMKKPRFVFGKTPGLGAVVGMSSETSGHRPVKPVVWLVRASHGLARRHSTIDGTDAVEGHQGGSFQRNSLSAGPRVDFAGFSCCFSSAVVSDWNS